MQKISGRRIARMGLMAALTAIGAFLVIPIQPIPFTMQPFFVFLAGIVLGPVDGAVSQVVYLAVGAIGIPVFAGMTGGLGHLLGPTGGFLFGFVGCALIAGLLAGKDISLKYWRGLLAIICGMAGLYLCGVLWLAQITGMGLMAALTVGAAPYLLFDLVKAILAAFLGVRLRRIFFSAK